MSNWNLIKWEGAWLFLLFLAVKTFSSLVGYIIGQSLESGSEFEKFLLYLVRWDLIQGLCDTTALLFLLAVGGLAFNRYRENAVLLIFFAVIWNALSVWKMVVIHFKCDFILHPTMAVVGWPSHDEYRKDPAIWVGYVIIMVSSISLMMIWAIRERKRRAAKAENADDHGNGE